MGVGGVKLDKPLSSITPGAVSPVGAFPAGVRDVDEGEAAAGGRTGVGLVVGLAIGAGAGMVQLSHRTSAHDSLIDKIQEPHATVPHFRYPVFARNGQIAPDF